MPLPTARREALEQIIRDSQHMRDLAAAAREDFLAYLLENVLHEARSTLIAAGHEPPAASGGAPRAAPSVVPMVPPGKPRKPRRR